MGRALVPEETRSLNLSPRHRLSHSPVLNPTPLHPPFTAFFVSNSLLLSLQRWRFDVQPSYLPLRIILSKNHFAFSPSFVSPSTPWFPLSTNHS